MEEFGLIKIYLLVFVLVMSIFSLGWFSNDLYHGINEKIEYGNKFDGLILFSNYTHPEAIQEGVQYDSKGEWVCVNIRGMSIERIIEVCTHESMHELYARFCQSQGDRCLNKTKELMNNLTQQQ